MKKIAFIGAGSFGFTRCLVRDLLTFEAFKDAELRLMDIDETRLGYISKAVQKIIRAGGYQATVVSTTDRAKALEGADGVCITILSGGVQVFRSDMEIPLKYGVSINIGDTRGPSGIFRFLRTAPAMMEICRDIEKYCPNAVVLNYTNPMAMLCRLMQGQSGISVTGLCHSVQGTAEMLAGWLKVPIEEVTYLCAGINHQAHYLWFRHKGADMYPQLRELMKVPEIYNEEQIRNEMFLNLDYYVTESSGHNSEYNAWFRKTPELLEKYCTHSTSWNPGHYGFTIKSYGDREQTWQQEILDWLNDPNTDLKRSNEYAANIFNACFGDNTMYEFNGNVRNLSLIENLPQGCCVEVPVVASRSGLRPVHVGPLPAQLALINSINAQCEELAVEGFIEGDRRKIYHAVLFDPLTSAVLSMAQIKDMVDEMFEFNKDYLGYFKN